MNDQPQETPASPTVGRLQPAPFTPGRAPLPWPPIPGVSAFMNPSEGGEFASFSTTFTGTALLDRKRVGFVSVATRRPLQETDRRHTVSITAKDSGRLLAEVELLNDPTIDVRERIIEAFYQWEDACRTVISVAELFDTPEDREQDQYKTRGIAEGFEASSTHRDPVALTCDGTTISAHILDEDFFQGRFLNSLPSGTLFSDEEATRLFVERSNRRFYTSSGEESEEFATIEEGYTEVRRTDWPQTRQQFARTVVVAYRPTAPKTNVGRPRGSTTVRAPLQPKHHVLLAPADGAMAGAMEAILAPVETWKKGPMGRPEYSLRRGHIDGSVAYIHPGDDRLNSRATTQRDLDALCDALWADVANLGAAELQLLMYVSNAWLSLAEATEGLLISAAMYAEGRGQKRAYAAARGSTERDRFNAMLSHLAHLDIDARIDTRVKGKQRVTRTVSGRLVLAEAIGKTFTTPLAGFDGPSRADVTHWRLVPGAAWLASRALGQLGRYAPALLTLDPYKHDLRVRLGFFLGQQTAVRASSGTLGQPLSVAAILRGIGVPIPDDRRRLADLRTRLETELDALQQSGVLHSWEWQREPQRGRDGLANAAIGYVYHWESVQEHAQHHAAARRALGTPAVRKLLPEASETSDSPDRN